MNKKQTIVLTCLVVFIISIYGIVAFEASRKQNTETDARARAEIEPEPEPELEPEPEPSWNVLGTYVISPDIWNEGNFSVPENASKIRLWFDVTISPPRTKYLMQVRVLKDGEVLWDSLRGPDANYSAPFDPDAPRSSGWYVLQTKVFEIEGISGNFTLRILVVFARTEFTVEWYG